MSIKLAIYAIPFGFGPVSKAVSGRGENRRATATKGRTLSVTWAGY